MNNEKIFTVGTHVMAQPVLSNTTIEGRISEIGQAPNGEIYYKIQHEGWFGRTKFTWVRWHRVYALGGWER